MRRYITTFVLGTALGAAVTWLAAHREQPRSRAPAAPQHLPISEFRMVSIPPCKYGEQPMVARFAPKTVSRGDQLTVLDAGASGPVYALFFADGTVLHVARVDE